MATPNFAGAYKGTVSFNGTNFNALRFGWKGSVPTEDITYSQPAGATFQVLASGYKSAAGTVAFVYDAANQPHLSPSLLAEGSTVAAIFTPEGTKPFAATILVESLDWDSGPQSGVTAKGTMSWKSTGPYTVPTS